MELMCVNGTGLKLMFESIRDKRVAMAEGRGYSKH